MLKTLPELESERFLLRARRPADLQAGWEMASDVTSRTFLGDGRWRPNMQAYLRWFLKGMEHDGWPQVGGFWMVEEKGTGQVIGWCGLFPMPDRGPIEIGYCLHPSVRGRGAAREAASRVLRHGFEDLNFDPICGVTHPANWRSQRVLQAIGLRREGQMPYHGKWIPFFRLTKAAFEAKRRITDRHAGQGRCASKAREPRPMSTLGAG